MREHTPSPDPVVVNLTVGRNGHLTIPVTVWQRAGIGRTDRVFGVLCRLEEGHVVIIPYPSADSRDSRHALLTSFRKDGTVALPRDVDHHLGVHGGDDVRVEVRPARVIVRAVPLRGEAHR